jgi:hypothetical protein
MAEFIALVKSLQNAGMIVWRLSGRGYCERF